jgi:capsular exopolysaccharide synthesis family protein
MELKDYFTPLRKLWWLILASTLVAVVVSFITVQQQPNTYRATTKLMIGRAIDNPNPTNVEFSLSQQLATTYADIANTWPVREQTMSRLGLDWLPEYTVRARTNSQLLEIAVTDTDPVRAQVVANELANQLILQSPTAPRPEQQERRAFIENELSDLEDKITETREEIAAKQDELDSLVSARQIAELQNQIATLQAKLTSLQSNYAALLANTEAGALNTLAIIDPAQLPDKPVGPNRLLSVLLAGVMGFGVAAGAAYLLDYLDDTVKTPQDVEELSGLPTLAGIARMQSENGSYELITSEHPRSPISEAYRVLRTGIQFSDVDKLQKMLLVTSPSPVEGKSITTANLAVVMAQAGHNVLLIDADLRRPVQHKIFSVNKNRGLTNLLLPSELDLEKPSAELTAHLEQCVQKTAEPGVSVLTSGPVPPNPSELLGSYKMKKLLRILATMFDIILLDSPPVLAVTDAVVLSTRVDGVVFVVNAGTTRGNQLKQGAERLREVNANLIGVVLNRLTPRSEGYYYYYYYQKSHYLEEPDGQQGQPPINSGNGRRLSRRKGKKGLAVTE